MPPKPLFSAFLVATLALAVEAYGKRRAVQHPRPLTNPLYTEGGYASLASVPQGSALELHIATSVSPFELEVVNLARPDAVLHTQTLSSSPRDCTGLSEAGCRWPVTTVLNVPRNWPSGFYAARFPTAFGTRNVFFIVREDAPGSTARMVIIATTNTYQAYNSFGGRSTYPSNSPQRAHSVSFERPYHDNRGLGRYPKWGHPFEEFLARENRAYEVITDSDVEDPQILRSYDVAVIVGHSEYWTLAGRQSLESFVDGGGRVAIFGGNTMWWQARLEENARRFTVYKSAALDPETGRNNAIVTTNWFMEPVLRPENLIIGSSFRHGGFTNRVEKTYGYTVTDAGHWLLAKTGTQNGQQFGAEAAGLEVDGALYNCTQNGLEPDGSDGTPLNFEIVATVPAAEGHGTIGVYTTPSGGAVFNAGTQDWALGLDSDAVVQQITRNVLDRFLSGLQAYEPVAANGVRMRELFNCPLEGTEDKLVPGWRGEEGELAFSARCAIEGPTGLELTGGPRIRLSRNVAPTGNAMNPVVTRFSVNADGIGGPASALFDLVTLQSRASAVVTRAARLELDPSTRSVRLALFNAGGTVQARTSYVALGAGWQPVEIVWRSPGTATLRIGNGPPQSLQNPTAGQSVTEVLLAYDQPALTGHLCVDALSLGLQ
ncbi:MAG TPA: N,N-dimethylformamidase beta subunit family domain-containing protein [Thermoanaerobaculia bacterium]|jgi:hypothetical protein